MAGGNEFQGQSKSPTRMQDWQTQGLSMQNGQQARAALTLAMW